MNGKLKISIMFKYLKWNDLVKSSLTSRVCLFSINLKNRGEGTSRMEGRPRNGGRKKDLLKILNEFSVCLPSIMIRWKSKDNLHSDISITFYCANSLHSLCILKSNLVKEEASTSSQRAVQSIFMELFQCIPRTPPPIV